ncbi:Protein kinase family protein [Euphorbia peplus]|nr:Protein kinase family protein [Euphorbia peplus]
MEQFRRIGEVLGSVKALMTFRDNIQINQRQCCLLLHVFSDAYESIAEQMKQNLNIEEQHTKWKILEQPLREIYKIFKEGEGYIRQCLETKNWFAKAVLLYQNADCVQFHIHNLLMYIPVVIEAIETAGEFSGSGQHEIQKKRVIYSKKYEKLWKDPNLFQWKFGKQYLITQDLCDRFDTAWKEDRWIIMDKIREKKIQCSSKEDRQLKDLLLKNLGDPENGKLLPSSFLLKSRDYLVRRRLGSQYKEIQWLGEGLVLRHLFGDIESLSPEISSLLSLSHPNVLHFLCGFTDEEKKECFLVMELMSKDLTGYINELCGPRNRIPFSVPVAVDLMLQIARGMEYLHSRKIYHGNLSPYNILVKPRNSSTEGYLQAKISGFGLSSVKNLSQKSPSSQNETVLPFIWYAPEVLEEAEQKGDADVSKYTEKADVYSFGMVCFELLTGKVPFEDSHLQGDKMSRNIRAGERPLFPLNSPKYVTNLTKRCWQTDPNQRPSFSSICRILRYTKRFLAMNPDYNREGDPLMPAVDYCDMELNLRRKFSYWDEPESSCSISQIPFQMFVYRAVEKEKVRVSQKETSESGSDKASVSGDENVNVADDITQPLPPPTPPTESNYPVCTSPDPQRRKPSSMSKKSPDHHRPSRQPGTTRGRSRPPQLVPCGRSLSLNSVNQLPNFSPRMNRRGSFGSDSELS